MEHAFPTWVDGAPRGFLEFGIRVREWLARGRRGSIVFRVLFVCTGNTCRSPMAAGALRERVRREEPATVEIAVQSAGTLAVEGRPAAREAVQACAGEGIDIRDHRSQPLSRELLAHSDLILVMEEAHRGEVLLLDPQAASRVHLIGDYAFLGEPEGKGAREVPDPIGGSPEDYRRTLRQLNGFIERIWQRIAGRMPRP